MKDFHALLDRIDSGLARGLIDQRTAAHYLGAHLAGGSIARAWRCGRSPTRRAARRSLASAATTRCSIDR